VKPRQYVILNVTSGVWFLGQLRLALVKRLQDEPPGAAAQERLGQARLSSALLKFVSKVGNQYHHEGNHHESGTPGIRKMHHTLKHWARQGAPMAIAAVMLTLLTGQALAGHDEDRGDYGWEGGGGYGPPPWQGGGGYGWYAPPHEEHDWHGGAHHDWHSGPHFGPHEGFHWDPVYGWHGGEHYGPHDEDHHDWHEGPHHDWY
jgi:hypothetical protein